MMSCELGILLDLVRAVVEMVNDAIAMAVEERLKVQVKESASRRSLVVWEKVERLACS